MSVTLSELKNRLGNAVAPLKSVPSDTQYDNAIAGAVADFGRRVPMQKMVLLLVESGVASYVLPDDFLRLIRLSVPSGEGNVIVSDAGLVPVGAVSERVVVSGGTLTIVPTPRYAVTRELWYMAGYAIDGAGVYPDMNDEIAGVVLLSAESRCLVLQANQASQEAWQYAIGDEKVSKEKLADALRKQAEGLQKRYVVAVAGMVGSIASRGWL